MALNNVSLRLHLDCRIVSLSFEARENLHKRFNGDDLRQSQELQLAYMFLIKASCHNFRDHRYQRNAIKGLMGAGRGLQG